MKRFILAFTALVGIGAAAAVADYTATQGAGTSFGSVIQLTVHYAKFVLCDFTAPLTQCATVSATGQLASNTSQINGVTPLMGNGLTGTGSQRVTIASDNTAFAVNSTLSAETTKVIGTVRNLGNAGAVFDAATGAAYPANAIAVGMTQGGNMTALTGTGGNLNTNVQLMNGVTVLMDNGATGTGAQRVVLANNNTLPTNWASSWAIASTTSGQTGPLAQCAVTTAAPTYTTAQTDPLSCDTAGSLRTTVINANTNGIKSPANSSPVVQAGMQYETVAASQTAQSLGATGATGDYLSHCIVYPTTTTPGVVTVFDNTNAAGTNVIAFPGGASSVSNLVPFALPVGAFSTAGAWKVTTGANLVVTCVGNFT